jgi:hypothetical protein
MEHKDFLGGWAMPWVLGCPCKDCDLERSMDIGEMGEMEGEF